jgi:hypothetical protein
LVIRGGGVSVGTQGRSEVVQISLGQLDGLSLLVVGMGLLLGDHEVVDFASRELLGSDHDLRHQRGE